MSTFTLQSACRLGVGVAVVALVTHTWLVMGLIVPVTVAGSSMAPTLLGPQRNYRCEVCQLEFAIGLDELPVDATAVCPTCRKWSAVAISDSLHGDRLFVDRTAFLLREPRRWEVVVFRSPDNPWELCVKRVVGLPGELIALSDGQIRINRKAIQSPQGFEYGWRYGDTSDAASGWQLGPGEYFVLGDNGAISADSRNWIARPGVDAKMLLGRPLGVR
jgi:signal peptidase I